MRPCGLASSSLSGISCVRAKHARADGVAPLPLGGTATSTAVNVTPAVALGTSSAAAQISARVSREITLHPQATSQRSFM